jgi:hypothetical protein
MPNLEKQLEYYTTHQNELVKKYRGKFIIIKDEQVKGAFDSQEEAYANAREAFELGTAAAPGRRRRGRRTDADAARQLGLETPRPVDGFDLRIRRGHSSPRRSRSAAPAARSAAAFSR